MADEQILLDEEQEEGLDFAEAIRRAESGQFEHTLFEMYEDMIQQGIKGLQGPLNLPTANSILRSWPMIKFSELRLYLKRRETRLQEAYQTLQDIYDGKKEQIFLENVDDWEVHKDLYIDLIVEWTKLTNEWAEQWMTMSDNRSKVVEMAVLMDLQAVILGEEGFVTQMRNLYGFNITEDEGAEITRRLVDEVSDE
jgi:hypothetical protein